MRLFLIAKCIVAQIILPLRIAHKAHGIAPTYAELKQYLLPTSSAIVISMKCLYHFDTCPPCCQLGIQSIDILLCVYDGYLLLLQALAQASDVRQDVVVRRCALQKYRLGGIEIITICPPPPMNPHKRERCLICATKHI